MLRGSFFKRFLSITVMIPIFLFVVLKGGIGFALLVVLSLLVSLFEMFGMARKLNKQTFIVFSVFALYFVVSHLLFYNLREEVAGGLFFLIVMIVTVWACDTGAYLSGKLIGGKKMAPEISPNKTWAGLIGGTFFAGLFMELVCLLSGFLENYSVINDMDNLLFCFSAFIIGCFIALLGQAGDLIISMLKRKSGVKDTGGLIPGHGGLLDRIDSLLLVSPIFTLFVMIVFS